MLTNTFTNYRNPKVETITDIPTILNLIKNNPQKVVIEIGRSFIKGHPVYEQIKTSLPTFTPNGCFTNIRSAKTLNRLSGFIYLDIDNQEVSTLTFKQIPWVYSYWKSFGGLGFNLLVPVSGLTQDNFKKYWSSIEFYFNRIYITIDPHCKDIARQSVISYDPDIYINPNVTPYSISNAITTSIHTTSTTLYVEYKPTDHVQIRYQTTLDNYNNMDCVVIPEGKDYRKTYLPRIIPKGERHKWMCSFTSSIIFNNPTITKEQLSNNVYKVNIDHCIPHLSKQDINSLVSWSLKKHMNYELKIKTKKKKIWINPDKKFTKKEKLSIIGIQSGKLRKENTIQSLIEVYKSLTKENSRVTQKLLQQNSTKSLRTIKKYWNEIIQGELCI